MKMIYVNVQETSLKKLGRRSQKTKTTAQETRKRRSWELNRCHQKLSWKKPKNRQRKATPMNHSKESRPKSKIGRPVNLADPKPKEVEEHWAKGHMPFKPWCPVCVKSRGKEDPHYADTKKEKEEKGLPRISIDYAEVGNGEDREDTRKLLVGRDRWTKTTFCHLVQCKGLGDTRISAKVRKSIDRTGNTDMTLKGDGEPALVQVMEDVKNKSATALCLITLQHTIPRQMGRPNVQSKK